MADHVVHALHAAGQGAVLGPADAAIAVKPTAAALGAKAVAAGRKVHGAVAVGDQTKTIRALDSIGEIQQLRREVAAVGDDFGAHVGMPEHELEHAAAHGHAKARTHRGDIAHRAPEVVHMAHAVGMGSCHLRPTGVGVAAGDQAASLSGGAIEGGGAWQFGGAGGDAHDAGLKIGLVFAGVWAAASAARMAADLVLGEEGAVEVHAGNACPVGRAALGLDFSAGLEHGMNLRRVARGGGGKQGGAAVAGVSLAGSAYGRGAAVHEVVAVAAVHMDVHKSWAEVQASAVNGGCACAEALRVSPADAADASALAEHIGLGQDAVRQNDLGAGEED